LKLKQLADISTGYSFRSQIRNDPAGVIKIIQMGDVDRYKGILTDQLKSIREFNPRSSHYFVESGNIILVNKGHNIFAYEIPKNLGKAVPVNSFLIIKIKKKGVDTGYLTWYLNSPIGQHYFKSVSVGTDIPNVSISALKSFNVELPSMERQKIIAKVEQLKIREINILQAIRVNKERYVDALLQSTVKSKYSQIPESAE